MKRSSSKGKLAFRTKTPKVKATFIFNKKIAKSFHNMDYYESQSHFQKNQVEIEAVKKSMSTSQKEEVVAIFDEYKDKGEKQVYAIHSLLYHIKEKRIAALKANLPLPKINNILSLIGNVNILLVAYRQVRKNPGALTSAWQIPIAEFNRLNLEQQQFLDSLFDAPDAINYKLIKQISVLVKNGAYPWGTSRLISIPKPGTKKTRPITIPPFGDKIVQEAIRMVLEAIYEPTFQSMNCSFGFRASNGVHQSICMLTERRLTNSMHMAIEGDIESAYQNVDRSILLNILGESISDLRFLSFMKKRLNLRLFDTADGLYKQTLVGLPQGGIDSPYLWNIYFLGFDIFVKDFIAAKFLDINHKRLYSQGNGKFTRTATGRPVNPHNPIYDAAINKINGVKRRITKIYQFAKKTKIKIGRTTRSDFIPLFDLLKVRKKLEHERRLIRSTDPNRLQLRFLYQRYADDWIIFCNAPMSVILDIKSEIASWLLLHRKAILSPEKTLITDMRKKEAHFLGFAFSNTTTRRLSYDKNGHLSRSAGWFIACKPDTQRLINRLYMKGYCSKTGFPKEVAWLSTMDMYSIIQRFNSVLLGFANFYAEFLTSPSSLNRWLYIIRWSAIKTIAQKFKTTCSGVFDRFGDSNNRICFTVHLKVPYLKNGRNYIREYSKTTYLYSEKNVLDKALALKRRLPICKELLDIERGEFINYRPNNKNRTPRILDINFINNINWVNARTGGAFGLPCSSCGAFPSEMHHIKHVRKRKFLLLDHNDVAGKMMALRNRKQIPLCMKCHDAVHAGKYSGTNLGKLYSNEIVNSENFITRAQVPFTSLPLEERLTERGWIAKQ